MSRYAGQVEKIFKTMKAPYQGFYVDMVSQEDYLELRVYEANIAEFNDMQKLALAEYLYSLRDAIRTTGVNCHIQGQLGEVPNRKWKGK